MSLPRVLLMGLLSGIAVPVAVQADVIWDQSWDGFTPNVTISQDFEPAFDEFDVQGLSDFTTTDTWALEIATAIYIPPNTLDGHVVGQIWDDRPSNGGVPILTSVASSMTLFNSPPFSFDLVEAEIDFGSQILAPGNYYFSSFWVFDSDGVNTVSLFETTTGNGVPDWLYNPGGGFGLVEGTLPQFGSSGPGELNFVLNGTIIPEPGCGALALLGIAGIVRRRGARV